jgi:DNA-binding response OmpR family regulator
MYMKILVVDDEALLVKGIRFNLQNDGYDVISGENGLDAVRLARDPEVNLIVLDIMMPEMDGLTACTKIREFSNVPIILLTAKTEDMDKLMGFDHGADDYMTKPFNILELKARIKALLRRKYNIVENTGSHLTIGNITLDKNSRNAFVSGKMVDLTAKEYDVVEYLMRHANQVFSREVLLDTIWAHEYKNDIRTVDVHIRRIREKLEADPAQPIYIMTKWGVGYYFKK